MFLWLKLLAFGVAFLGQDAFLKGQETSTTGPENTTVIPEADCDIIQDVKDFTEDLDNAEVFLNITTKDREYVISGGGKNITVNSSSHSIELPKCHIYTVEVKTGKCSKNTSFQIPKGRCTRILVVSLKIFFQFCYMQ
ncbi:PREDICTED: uncharacterized protein LOC106858822 isoform X2 [Sturnus vulgaris]|uniref:uncharacterized protein LOC106858822 isoform X2 n=1 Tax=Sturnus vulgaris TaxID=9172 RepID=UPI00071A1F65|nr:PREDICTED: uncharacterized protein LOC106858822 isoform X2 [Sturnus vulgaris]